MHKKPIIAVIGCGYTGLTTAAVLANSGFRVHALENDPGRLAQIKGGRAFFYEAGLDSLLAESISSGQLAVSYSYDNSIPECDIVFSCVGTPDNPDGSSNLNFVFEAASSAGQLMKAGSIFVQKSTVPVGTGQKIIEGFKKAGRNISYVSNPEFLRESTAVADTLWSDRVVSGGADNAAVDAVLDIYRQVEASRNEIAKIAGVQEPSQPDQTEYYSTDLNSAELIKVTANAFLALKISFANSIAKLADKSGSNITEVMNIIGADKRIGRAFLNAGRGYGGGCFPKDVSGLIRSAEEYGVNLEIMEVAAEVNSSMPHYIINRVRSLTGNSFSGKKVAVLGLAFKAGTSDTRRSPAITIANSLAQQGAKVSAYDPQAMDEAKPELEANVKLAETLDKVVEEAEYIFIATDWPEFTKLDYINDNTKVVVDCMNCIDAKQLPKNVRYVGVGRQG